MNFAKTAHFKYIYIIDFEGVCVYSCKEVVSMGIVSVYVCLDEKKRSLEK